MVDLVDLGQAEELGVWEAVRLQALGELLEVVQVELVVG